MPDADPRRKLEADRNGRLHLIYVDAGELPAWPIATFRHFDARRSVDPREEGKDKKRAHHTASIAVHDSEQQHDSYKLRTHVEYTDATVSCGPILHALLLDLQVTVRLGAEVALVEVMHTHETVLTARCVAVALWRDGDPVLINM